MMKIDFEDDFNATILSRGYEYYKDGLVKDVIFDNDIATAKVEGTTTYDVSVEIENGMFIDGDCTCPYASDGSYCKHMAALLYYLDNGKIYENSNYTTKEEIIRNSLKKLNKTDLDEFLVELLMEDKDIFDKFRLRFNKLFPSLTLKEYKKKIYDAINRSAGRDGFIDYNESWDYTHNMYNIINEADTLVGNGEYDLAFDIVKTILDSIPDTSIDDSNGSTGEVAASCIETIEKILENILNKDSNLAKRILDYILNETKTGYLSNYGIGLYPLLDLFVEKGVFFDEIEKGLLEALEHGKKEKYFWNAKYYVDILITIYDKENAKDKITNLLKTYSHDKKICFKLVEKYLKEDNADEAVKLLKTRLEEDSDRDYALKLSDIYLKENMHAEYKDILYKLLYELDKYDIGIYKKIKSLYSKDDWLVERKNIIDKIMKEERSWWYEDKLLKIYIEEEMYDNIYNDIKNKDMDTIVEYEKYLLPKYNKELINIYVKGCETFANHANNRKMYRELASKMRHIKNMDGSEKSYKELVSALSEQLRNKSAMRDELKGVL